MADNFSIWIARPNMWYKRDGRSRGGWSYLSYYCEGDAPRKVGHGFREPVEAADLAEEYLTKFGTPGQTYAELRFNGDKEPHTVICYLENENFGVFNAPLAKWPMFYPEGGSGTMLDGIPAEFVDPDLADEGTPEDENSDGFGDVDEDSKLMDLGADPNESESDDDSDEDDDLDEEDEDAEDEDDFTDDEPEDAEPENEDEADDGDEADPDKDEGESESDDEGENDSESDEESDDEMEEEMELPRLRLFAKMRGPLGWRKRADLEELNDRNVFAMKVGVLRDEDDLTRAQQERDTFVHVEFVEKDENRKSGILRLRLPDGMTLEDFKQTGSGWITAEVPLPREDES